MHCIQVHERQAYEQELDDMLAGNTSQSVCFRVRSLCPALCVPVWCSARIARSELLYVCIAAHIGGGKYELQVCNRLGSTCMVDFLLECLVTGDFL
jgi:hypothetical protein